MYLTLFCHVPQDKVVNHPASIGPAGEGVKRGEVFNTLRLELATDFLHSGGFQNWNIASVRPWQTVIVFSSLSRNLGPLDIFVKRAFYLFKPVAL